MAHEGDLFSFCPEQQRVVGYFGRNFANDPERFVSAIDRRCQMYRHGFADPEHDARATFVYFDSALKMLHPLKALAEWRFGGLSQVERLLDFASGFGRLTRFLVQEARLSAIVVSDIQAEAVEFQRKAFGVDGFVSVTDPARLRCPHSFDCIFVASLFTHLPEHRFRAWLARLIELLTPRGMLVFSVHDQSLLLPHRPMPPSGVDFNSEVSEIDTLERSEYGSTFVSPSFMDRTLEAASRGQGSHHRIPRGLWHHDLYVYTKDGSAGAERPGAGILIPQDIAAPRGSWLPLWFLETDPAHRVTRVELTSRGDVIAASDAERAVAFTGDSRFLPAGWAAPLYVAFPDVPGRSYASDVVLEAYSTSGRTRRVPLWCPR